MNTTAPAARPPGIEDGGKRLLDWLRYMRQEQPVHRDENGVWHVFRHGDVQRVVTDHVAFSSDQRRAQPDAPDYGQGNLTVMDPPAHRTLRRLVSQAFSARAIDQLGPRIREVSESLAGALDPDGCDLVRDFCYPLPVIVIAELLGIPPEDRVLFKSWADTLINAAGARDEAAAAAFQEAVRETTGYLLQHCQERRSRPRADLMSRLVAAEMDGERLGDEEVVTFSGLLLMSGHVTTTVLLGNALLCLDEHPEVAELLRADPGLVPPAVEEVMRYRTPFMYVKRVTAEPVELSGVTVPANAPVLPWLVSANRDGAAFERPDEFDLYRTENTHLALGRGIHFCLGASLARLESRIALEVLLDRFPDIRLRAEPPLRGYGESMFGLRELPAGLTPATSRI